jgi:hypothetical protein
MSTIAIPVDALKVEHDLALAAGYLANEGYQAGLTQAQVDEVHDGIVAIGVMQAMCGTLRHLSAFDLTLELTLAEAGR